MFLKSLPKSILCARPKSMILMRGWGTERFSSMMFSGWRTHKQIKNKNSKVRMWPKKKTQMWSDKPDTESNEKLFLFLINSIGKRSDDFRRSAEIKTDRGTKTAGQTNTGKLRQEGEPISTSRTRPGGGRREKDGALDEPRKQKSHIPENTKSPWGKDSEPPNLWTSSVQCDAETDGLEMKMCVGSDNNGRLWGKRWQTSDTHTAVFELSFVMRIKRKAHTLQESHVSYDVV